VAAEPRVPKILCRYFQLADRKESTAY